MTAYSSDIAENTMSVNFLKLKTLITLLEILICFNHKKGKKLIYMIEFVSVSGLPSSSIEIHLCRPITVFGVLFLYLVRLTSKVTSTSLKSYKRRVTFCGIAKSHLFRV